MLCAFIHLNDKVFRNAPFYLSKQWEKIVIQT